MAIDPKEETPVEALINSIEVARTLESDIIGFTTNLPYWEQYLSEKILVGPEITDADYNEALKYFLEDAGLLDPDEKRPKINIVCRENTGIYKIDLQLSKLSDVAGVNALVAGQMLEFGKNLTIIYGSNGSGKSGYIRLLNNVFITKGEKSILPNIHDAAPLAKKAAFEFSSAGTSYTLNYPQDCSMSEFKQFSVFDEKAVHAHLNNKNQFEFRPSGLSYFAGINEGCKRMEEMVQQRIDQHAQSADLTALFDGESEIKTLMAQLSDKTKLEVFKDYKVFTEEDKAERKQLEESKAELMALKKDKEISDLTQIKAQLGALKTGWAKVNNYFSIDQLTKAADKIKDCIEKEKLAASNSIDQFKNDQIIGVGDTPWRDFILAADIFARFQGNPPDDYPSADDICILCHQPLSAEAAKLVASYWAFIKSKAEQDAKDAQSALTTAKAAFEKLDLNLLPDTTTLYKWLSENKSDALKTFTNYLIEQAKLKGSTGWEH